MTIQSLRRMRIAPMKQTRPRESKGPRFRGSARERGYDRDWEKLRDKHRVKAEGLCQECLRRGYIEPLAVSDHIIPIRLRPDLRLDENNLDALCTIHHNGWKAKLEAYAEKHKMVDMLPIWVKQPDLRPPRFQIRKYGPMAGEAGE